MAATLRRMILGLMTLVAVACGDDTSQDASTADAFVRDAVLPDAASRDAAAQDADRDGQPQDGATIDDATSSDGGADANLPTELKAFPTAYGAGAAATGGRGGRVFYVTTRADGGEGSLRWALTQRGPRTVVFAVGGEFALTEGRIKLNLGDHDDLTVAGQTAPGDGVTITGNYILLEGIDNVIIRYVRFRGVANATIDTDIITAIDSTNIILDHCSASWATDEIFSFTSKDEGGFTGNITTQRSLMAEMDPGHSTASLNGAFPPYDATNAGDFSWHENYVYNISHRFPNVLGAGRFEIKNNVIYNWRYRLTAMYYGATVNQQNNYYLKGPATVANANGNEGGDLEATLNRVGNTGTRPMLFIRGNLVMPDVLTDPEADNWRMSRWFSNENGLSRGDVIPRSMALAEAPASLGFALPERSAEDAFEAVLSNVGANRRLTADGTVEDNTDAHDAAYIQHARDRSGTAAYAPVASWALAPLEDPANDSGYLDTDQDGMPDRWEVAQGLDPEDPSDGNGDADADGYTNLEEFLNRVDG